MAVVSKKDFLKLCYKTQEELLEFLPKLLVKDYHENDIIITPSYIYCKGSIPVMLVAHLDTVHKQPPQNIFISLDGNILKADEGIGGDDRCGVYAILKVISSLQKNQKPSVLFTTDEEIGGLGVSQFCKDFQTLEGVNCFIEIDRRGENDVVNYDDDNTSLISIFEELGYELDYGSYTDICDLMEAYNISGVNLSSGYYKAHTTEEYVKLDELEWTINKVIQFMLTPEYYSTKHEFQQAVRYKGYYNYGGYNNYISNYYNYYHKPLYNDMDDYTAISKKCRCLLCHKEIEDDEVVDTPDGELCEECIQYYSDIYTFCPHCGGYTYNDLDECFLCGHKLILEADEDTNGGD